MRLWRKTKHKRPADEATASARAKRDWPVGGAAGMMGMTTDPESFPGNPLLSRRAEPEAQSEPERADHQDDA